jgi:hypothetical protein
VGIRIYGNEIRGAGGDAIFSSSSTSLEIRGNWIHHNGTSSQVINGSLLSGHGVYISGTADLTIIDGNLVEDQGNSNGGWGFHVYGGGTGSHVGRITMSNNVLRRISQTAITCIGQEAVSLPGNFCRVFNNEIHTSGSHGISFIAARDGLAANNTLYATAGLYIERTSNPRVQNNIVTSGGITNNGDNTGTIIINTNLTSDPGLVNPAGGNLQLGAGAATAIDDGVDLDSLGVSGLGTSLTNTFISAVGVVRDSQGSGWDIGAHEFIQAGSDTTPPVVTITVPTSSSTYATDITPLATLAGTCSDNVAVSSVTWVNSQGGSGTAPGTTSWSVSAINLIVGVNTITVTCTDTSSNPHTDQIAVTYSTPAITPELVLAMALDAGSGTSAVDTSGKSNNGNFAGSGTAWVPGKYGTGLLLDGAGYVSVPDANTLDLTTSLTLMAWVNPSTLATSYRAIISKATTSGGNLFALFASASAGFCPAGRVMGFFNGSAGSMFVCSTAALSINTLAHVALTYDGINLRLYIDGALNATQAANGVMAVGTGLVRVGSTVFDEFFTGLIDEPRIYTYARSLTEIQTDRDTRITEPPPPPGVSGLKIGSASSLKCSTTACIKIGE